MIDTQKAAPAWTLLFSVLRKYAKNTISFSSFLHAQKTRKFANSVLNQNAALSTAEHKNKAKRVWEKRL